jgi:hypothetical protein
MNNGELAHESPGALTAYQPEAVELSVDEIVRKVEKVRDVAARVMKEDIHFGIIPGTDKPTLYKPGAEILGLTFMLAPRYEGERQPIDLGNGHREYIIRCDMYHKVNGRFLGSGVGSCSTMESKYRFRPGPVIPTGKPVPKEYWDCRKSDPKNAQSIIGGKGFSTKKVDGKWEIVQAGEVIENPNIADTYNTVLKIGSKRAYIDATLKATAASEVYTQDAEDIEENNEALHQTNGGESQSSKSAPIQQPQRKSESAGNDQPPHLADQAPQQADTQSPAQKAADPNKISEAQQKRLWAIARGNGFTDAEIERVCKEQGYEHKADIPKSDYDRIVKLFQDAH